MHTITIIFIHDLVFIAPDEKDNPPIANAGKDVVVQSHDEVMLNGIESMDDKKIVNYTWTLVKGNASVVMKVLHILLEYEQ